MKTIRLAITFFAVVMAVILTGCAKEDDNADPGARDAFLGQWNVQETWTKLTYEVTISADPNSSDGVFISGFAGTLSSSTPASAVISGASIILDADQVIGDGLTVNGSGTLSGTKINWNYTMFDGATLINAIAIYSRL